MHQLGIRTHAELKALPSTELDNWLYFFSIEPAGFLADNWRAGIATASLMNATLNLKSSDALKPSDIYQDPREHLHIKFATDATKLRNLFKNI
ncbi:MAG: hypothetical protein HRU08_08340 [Oleispira sp.]|nr:hypothetical protein [Oleispira sp.]